MAGMELAQSKTTLQKKKMQRLAYNRRAKQVESAAKFRFRIRGFATSTHCGTQNVGSITFYFHIRIECHAKNPAITEPLIIRRNKF